MEIYTWALSLLLAASPPGRTHYIKEAQETVDEATTRYQSIVHDVVDVVYNGGYPPLFGGPYGRARTVSVVLSVMFFESGFRKDVDYGLGKLGRGDAGNSWCLLQIQTGKGKTITWNKSKMRLPLYTDPPSELVGGWYGQELVDDRKKCIEAGLRLMKVSFGSCQGTGLEGRLRAYASGSCDGGEHESLVRMGYALRWYNQHPAPQTDQEVIAELTTAKSATQRLMALPGFKLTLDTTMEKPTPVFLTWLPYTEQLVFLWFVL